MFCSNCGVKIDDNARFCFKCGSKVSFDGEGTSKNSKSFTLICPDCGAELKYGTEIDHVTCNFCGAVVMLNDDAAKMDRLLKAKSNAIIRDTATRIRYENEQHKRELEKMSLENDHKLSPYKDLNPLQRHQYNKEKRAEAEVKRAEAEVMIKELEVKQAAIEALNEPNENRTFLLSMGLIVFMLLAFLIFFAFFA